MGAARKVAGVVLLGALLCPGLLLAASKKPSATGGCPAGTAVAPDGTCSHCAAVQAKGQEACGEARKACSKRCDAAYQKCLKDPNALRCDANQDKCNAACDATRSGCFAAREKTFVDCHAKEGPRKK
jgi:hypothetical protein